MSGEWGPWIEHDNLGMPPGVTAATVVICRMAVDGHVLTPLPASDIDWCHSDAVEAYRVRKPRGLTILENLINEIPNPVAHVEPQGSVSATSLFGGGQLAGGMLERRCRPPFSFGHEAETEPGGTRLARELAGSRAPYSVAVQHG